MSCKILLACSSTEYTCYNSRATSGLGLSAHQDDLARDQIGHPRLAITIREYASLPRGAVACNLQKNLKARGKTVNEACKDQSSMCSMPKRNLLLCFDAFGTLFWPKPTVAQQYGQVARQCGMAAGWTQLELQSHLAAAIQDEAKVHPNYGKASGLGPTQWWTNVCPPNPRTMVPLIVDNVQYQVIYKTFQPFARDQPLPADLAPTLLKRFSSSRGYHVELDLVTTLKRLKKQKRSNMAFDRIVIGVVTNSDDRVPSVLSSFGLSVSPLRYGTHVKLPFGGQPCDIDFTCMSYDTGYGKPHAGMFRAAEHLLTQVVAAGDIQTVSEADLDTDSWQKLHVGDEDAKDVVGALNAGWNPVLLDQDGKSAEVPSLEEQSNQSISAVFQRHSTVRVQSIRNLVSWLLGETDRDRRCEA